MEEECDCIDDWYELGRKLFNGEPRFVLYFNEEDPPERVHVFFKNNSRPCFFKCATLRAFLQLKERRMLQFDTFGKGSRTMQGWILTKEGRKRIGYFNKDGHPISPQSHFISPETMVSRKRLPRTGLLRDNT